MKAFRLAKLSMMLGLGALCASGQAVHAGDGEWTPTRAPAIVATSYPPAQPASAVSLGVPRAAAQPAPVNETAVIRIPRIDTQVTPTSYSSAALEAPHATFRAQAPENAPPPPPPSSSAPIAVPGSGIPPAPGNELYNQGAVTNNNGGGVWDHIKGFCTADNWGKFNGFCSDHCDFDYFSTPITSPFLTEDPRALTEVRPIFMWQTIPDSNPQYRGGNAYYYGLQARVAITQQWSLVINKLGGLSVNPNQESGEFTDGSGFAEIWLGPKWTFYRNEADGRLAAAGLTFQIPNGSSKVQQDTGDFTLAPYLSFAQTFGRTSYGAFNLMSTTGYAFSVNGGRSDYFYSNYHLDFDVLAWHKFYPMVELNWIRNTTAGNTRPQLNFEGDDLINYGSGTLTNKNFFTIATGMRYKFSEHVQLGGAIEFPFSDRKDIQDYRLTFDMIFRY